MGNIFGKIVVRTGWQERMGGQRRVTEWSFPDPLIRVRLQQITVLKGVIDTVDPAQGPKASSFTRDTSIKE